MSESNQMQMTESGVVTSVPGLEGEYAEKFAGHAAGVDAVLRELREAEAEVRASDELTEEGKQRALNRLREEAQAKLGPSIEAAEKFEAAPQVFVETVGANPSIPGDKQVFIGFRLPMIDGHARSMDYAQRRAWFFEHADDPEVLYAALNAPESLALLEPEDRDALRMRSAEQRYPELFEAYRAESLLANMARANVQHAQKLVSVPDLPEA